LPLHRPSLEIEQVAIRAKELVGGEDEVVAFAMPLDPSIRQERVEPVEIDIIAIEGKMADAVEG
jgi:hypothetical protein